METKPAATKTTTTTVPELFKNEISKLNDMSKSGDFIDSCVMFHAKNCEYRICLNCFFVDDLTKIYVITNYQDENQENQVKYYMNF